MSETCISGGCQHPKEDHDETGCLVEVTRYGFGSPQEGELVMCGCLEFRDDVRGGSEGRYPMDWA